jgi:hypothetical protein
MNLTSLLQIDVMVLNDAERRGLQLAQELWEKAGGPTEPEELVAALENILQCSRAKGIRYPPVLLLRKKELHRKTVGFGSRKKTSAPAGEPIQRCSLCRGAGVLIDAKTFTATLCPNGCFLKRVHRV